MSQILSEWLNEEIKLSHKINPTELDQVFRSGYLFGELLNRFNVQKDFEKFLPSRSTDACVSNFTRLEPTLHTLGIPFNAQICRDLMAGKPGAAAKMLYQLRITLPKVEKLQADKPKETLIDKIENAHKALNSYPSTPKSKIIRFL
jgi:hypothetical protein